MKIAVVGATGLVGSEILRVLEEREFPITTLLPVASQASVGKSVAFQDQEYKVVSVGEAIEQKPDLALFSAGGTTSLDLAPKFTELGTTVIDNSSAWRMSPNHKLIVPEINGKSLTKEDKIIANPNCSTIQMVMALYPLSKYGIRRLVISTYQSVTGTGKKAVDQLTTERQGKSAEKVYPYQIDMNVLPHIDVFLENDYTKEEMKMINETRKILGNDNIRITATCVRLPVIGGHSESVNVEFEDEFDLEEVKKLLAETKGIILKDDVDNLQYPMPIDAHGKDEVFVGRLRRDEGQDKTLNMWIVADNLRKGAATNAVQIAEYLAEHALV